MHLNSEYQFTQLVSETTNDYSYCRAIMDYMLGYAEKCEIQAVDDYPHGAPISVFCMFWIEAYINHVILSIFPDEWDKKSSDAYRYSNLKKKYKFICKELELNNSWSAQLEALKEFRDRLAHGRTVEISHELGTNDANDSLRGRDSFNRALGTITEVRERVKAAEAFLLDVHTQISACSREISRAQYDKGRHSFDPLRIDHPIHSVLSSTLS